MGGVAGQRPGVFSELPTILAKLAQALARMAGGRGILNLRNHRPNRQDGLLRNKPPNRQPHYCADFGWDIRLSFSPQITRASLLPVGIFRAYGI